MNIKHFVVGIVLSFLLAVTFIYVTPKIGDNIFTILPATILISSIITLATVRIHEISKGTSLPGAGMLTAVVFIIVGLIAVYIDTSLFGLLPKEDVSVGISAALIGGSIPAFIYDYLNQ